MNRHAQPDLFAEIATKSPFRPAPAHVLSGLERLHARLAEATTWWGFTDWDIERFRTREPAYYCGLLDDAALAQDWRARLEGEIARLDAASGPVRPE
jgi:hypothetical protein